MTVFSLISYAVVGVSYTVLSILLLTSWRGRHLGGILIGACLMSAAWAAVSAINAAGSDVPLITIYAAQVSTNGCDNAEMLGMFLFFAVIFGLTGTFTVFIQNRKKHLKSKILVIALAVLIVFWCGESIQIYHLSTTAVGDCD